MSHNPKMNDNKQSAQREKGIVMEDGSMVKDSVTTPVLTFKWWLFIYMAGLGTGIFLGKIL